MTFIPYEYFTWNYITNLPSILPISNHRASYACQYKVNYSIKIKNMRIRTEKNVWVTIRGEYEEERNRFCVIDTDTHAHT